MKRELLRRLLSATGLRALRLRFLPRGLYCFNYHRVGDPLQTDYDRGVFSCTQANFRQQVRVLRDHFDVVTLDRLVRLMKQGGSAPKKPMALITFDDGYIDNYELVFPVLKELQTPAVFFLPTSYIESDRVPWWDQIAWTLRRATVPTLQLAGVDGQFDVGPTVTEQTIRRVLHATAKRSTPMAEQVQEITERCKPRTDGAARPRLFMSWDNAREMHAGGMDIGAHTHNHEILAHLSTDTQRNELEQSKSILETQLKAPINSIAYPVGKSWTYNADTCRLAGELGYDLGFTFESHANTLPIRSRFEVGRFAADGDLDRERMRTFVAFPNL